MWRLGNCLQVGGKMPRHSSSRSASKKYHHELTSSQRFNIKMSALASNRTSITHNAGMLTPFVPAQHRTRCCLPRIALFSGAVPKKNHIFRDHRHPAKIDFQQPRQQHRPRVRHIHIKACIAVLSKKNSLEPRHSKAQQMKKHPFSDQPQNSNDHVQIPKPKSNNDENQTNNNNENQTSNSDENQTNNKNENQSNNNHENQTNNNDENQSNNNHENQNLDERNENEKLNIIPEPELHTHTMIPKTQATPQPHNPTPHAEENDFESTQRLIFERSNMQYQFRGENVPAGDVPRLSDLELGDVTRDTLRPESEYSASDMAHLNKLFGDEGTASNDPRDYAPYNLIRRELEAESFRRSRDKNFDKYSIFNSRIKFIQFDDFPEIPTSRGAGNSPIRRALRSLGIGKEPTLADQRPRAEQHGMASGARVGAPAVSVKEYMGAAFQVGVDHLKQNWAHFRNELPFVALARAMPATPVSPERAAQEQQDKEDRGVKFVKTVEKDVPGDSWLSQLLGTHDKNFDHFVRNKIPQYLTWHPKMAPNPENVEPPWHYKWAAAMQHWASLAIDLRASTLAEAQERWRVRKEYAEKVAIPYEPLPPRVFFKRWLIKKLGAEHLNRYRITGAHELADWIEDVGQLYEPEREMYRAFAPRRKTPLELRRIPMELNLEAIDTINKLELKRRTDETTKKLKDENREKYWRERSERETREREEQEENARREREEEERLNKLLDELMDEQPEPSTHLPTEGEEGGGEISPDDEAGEPTEGEGGAGKVEEEGEAEAEPAAKSDPADWFAGDDDEDDDMLNVSIDFDEDFDDEPGAGGDQPAATSEPNPFGWEPSHGTQLVAIPKIEVDEDEDEFGDLIQRGAPKIAYVNRKGETVVGEKRDWSAVTPPSAHGSLGEGEGSLGEEVAAQMIYFWDEMREIDPYFNLGTVKHEVAHYVIPRLWAGLFGYEWEVLETIAAEEFCREAVPILQKEAFAHRHFVNLGGVDYLPNPRSEIGIPTRQGLTLGSNRASPELRVSFELAMKICWVDPTWDTVVEGDRDLRVRSNWNVNFTFNRQKRKWEVWRLSYKTLPAAVEGDNWATGTFFTCPEQPLPNMKRSELWDDFANEYTTYSKMMDKGMWASDEELENRWQFLKQRREAWWKIRDPPYEGFWNHQDRFQPWQRSLRLQQWADDPKVRPEDNPGNRPVANKDVEWELPRYFKNY